MSTIRILYFQGCPNHPPAVEMARQIIEEHDLDASVEEVEVTTPDDVVRYSFLGSPTVQVDGVDIDPAARTRTDFVMSCRVFGTPDGLPPREMMLEALGIEGDVAPVSKDTGCCRVSIQDTPQSPGEVIPARERAGFLTAGGSVATAMLSSACCWVPLLFLAFGTSAAGASALLARWRPVFIAFALIMLALGFYFSYFRKTVCADGCCGERKPRGRRLQRAMLWGSAVVVAAFIFFPNYVGLLLNGSSSTVATTTGRVEAGAREYAFHIDGMHCAGCAVTLRNELVKLEGVVEAQVDYANRTARLRATGDGIASRVADVASRVGYTATPRVGE